MESRVYDLEKDLKRKEAKHTKAMAEALENATNDYAALEKQHH
jgi:threonine aldolase